MNSIRPSMVIVSPCMESTDIFSTEDIITIVVYIGWIQHAWEFVLITRNNLHRPFTFIQWQEQEQVSKIAPKYEWPSLQTQVNRRKVWFGPRGLKQHFQQIWADISGFWRTTLSTKNTHLNFKLLSVAPLTPD